MSIKRIDFDDAIPDMQIIMRLQALIDWNFKSQKQVEINDPYLNKKAEEAWETLKKVGLPQELLKIRAERMKK